MKNVTEVNSTKYSIEKTVKIRFKSIISRMAQLLLDGEDIESMDIDKMDFDSGNGTVAQGTKFDPDNDYGSGLDESMELLDGPAGKKLSVD